MIIMQRWRLKEIKDELNPLHEVVTVSRCESSFGLGENEQSFYQKNNGIISAVRQENKKKILFEYLLALDLKVKRGEYADFIRGITPLIIDLLEMVLEQFAKLMLHSIIRKKKENGIDIN